MLCCHDAASQIHCREQQWLPQRTTANNACQLLTTGLAGCLTLKHRFSSSKCSGSYAQVECPAVTPEVVLRASGHVERFTDLMVTDQLTGDCHRADHLLEHHLEALLEDSAAPLSAEKRKVHIALQVRAELKPPAAGQQSCCMCGACLADRKPLGLLTGLG